MPMEPMLPMPMLPAGFQLVREPSTGQLMVLPTAPTIGSCFAVVVASKTPATNIIPINPPHHNHLSHAHQSH